MAETSDSRWSIDGHTAHPALTQANVQLRIGSEEHHAQTDEAGRFSLEIPAPAESSMITVEVHGRGEQQGLSHARLIGIAGDHADTLEATDTVPIGPISPLSSVLYILAEHAADGRIGEIFSTDASGPRVMDVSGFVFLLAADISVKGGVLSLPGDAAHSLDMLRQPALVLQLLDELSNDSDLRSTVNSLMESIQYDAVMYQTPPHKEPLDQVTGTGALPPGAAARLRLDGPAAATGMLVSSNYDGPVAAYGLVDADLIWASRFEWTSSTFGRWEIQPAPGTELPIRRHLIDLGQDPVPYVDYLEWIRWQSLDASESIEALTTNWAYTRVFPENPEIEPWYVVNTSRFNARINFSEAMRSPDWPELAAGSQWLLPLCLFPMDGLQHGPAWQGPLGHDKVTFTGPGTAVSERSSLAFNWQLDNGSLVLSANGHPETRLELLGDDGWASVVIASCHDSESGRERINILRTTVPAADEPTLTVPARFVSGFDLQSYLPPLRMPWNAPLATYYWIIDLQEDGSGQARVLNDPTEPMPPDRYSLDWSTDTDGLIEIHFNPSETYGVPQSRSWLPLRQQNEDVIVLESLYQGERDELNDELHWPGRYNWYRITDIPPVDDTQ